MEKEHNFQPFGDREIRAFLEQCPRLASLRSVSQALGDLFKLENAFVNEIAGLIGRDPSLTTRLLRLANSGFYGVTQKISSIEDAIFLLGMRQVRDLAIATPIMEDFERLNPNLKSVDWTTLWQHSIGCAILTRELLSVANEVFQDDTDYIVGLLHNVGKVAMAFSFPEQFTALSKLSANSIGDFTELEKEIIGWDHAAIGAYYLERHNISEPIVEAVRHHNHPKTAKDFKKLAAAIQVADALLRSIGIPCIENVVPPTQDDCRKLDGWSILFPNADEFAFGIQSIEAILDRLPMMIQGMI